MPAFRKSMPIGKGDTEVFLDLEAGLRNTEPQRLGIERGEVSPGNVVWIFGAGRSGTTWLRSMLTEMKGYLLWEEPMVGRLFGRFYVESQQGQRDSRNFIMGDPTREYWIRSVRNFVLEGAAHAVPRLKREDYLIVKEPNGSMGAPLLVESLPESRMIFLLRDPRDVMASVLDGARGGSWLYERKDRGLRNEGSFYERDPETFTRQRISQYLRNVNGAREAYEAHRGFRSFVRYEDLRTNMFKEMERICAELDLETDDAELSHAVEKHAWENIPEEQKGEGKFYRKADPGSWREDLRPKEIEIIEEAATPLLKEFYPNG